LIEPRSPKWAGHVAPVFIPFSFVEGRMDRTERFYKIELMLRNRGCVSFEALQAHLEVSPATLKRDLQYLRERMDAPIVYDRLENGYRFGASEGGRSKLRHELPGTWFSEPEIHAMLTMHQLMAGLDDDGVLARHLQPMMEKLQGMLGTDASEAKELMKRVKVLGTARRRAPSQHFELLGSALMQRKRVRIQYFKRSEQRRSEREVSAQRLVHYRGTWYLDAWCHQAEALRRFALDAIEQASTLDTRAKVVALKEVEAAFDAGYGIYGGSSAKVKWATLVFTPEAAQWVAHEEWHPKQKAKPQADGSLELQVPYTDATELVMDILRHGSAVYVKADKTLQRAVAQGLQKAAALYA
jgi:predicted DNA-binding transcriptional regulator YafY